MKIYALGITAVILFIAILYISIDTPTGLTIEQESYAKTLNTIITQFYDVTSVQFPQGACAEMLQDAYNNIAYENVDTTNGYTTNTREKFATISFVTGRINNFGTLDLIKGKPLFKENIDGYISLYIETAVRVPKKERITFFEMDAYGTTQNNFIIQNATFSTPTLNCTLTTIQGKAQCNCNVHPMEGAWSD